MPELSAAMCTGFRTQERRTQAQEQAQEQGFQALKQQLEQDAAQRGREAQAIAAQVDEMRGELRELRDAQRRAPPELVLAQTGPDGLPRFITYHQVRPSSLGTYIQSINQ